MRLCAFTIDLKKNGVSLCSLAALKNVGMNQWQLPSQASHFVVKKCQGLQKHNKEHG